MRTFASEDGKLVVADEVLAAVAARAAESVPGIAKVAGQGEGLAGLFGRERPPKGVGAVLDDERAEVSLDVVVAYGADIRATARALIAAVHEAARRELGLRLDDVDVRVVGVEAKGGGRR